MRLHKPIGIGLLLWPTLWSLWIAGNGHPSIKVTVIFIMGTLIMRSAGCIINDYADRHLDGHVARTRTRPLVTHELTPKAAIFLFLGLIALALLLVCQLNTLTIQLSFLGFALTLIYPWTKRFIYWPQLVLGMAFASSVPMAFAAQTNHLPPLTWLLYGIAVLWPLVYDTLYAMEDRQDDLVIGIKSTAVLLQESAYWVIAVWQLLLLLLFIALGLLLNFGGYYYSALAIASGLMGYQHYLLHCKPHGALHAFTNNHWLGMVIFLGIGLSYPLLNH